MGNNYLKTIRQLTLFTLMSFWCMFSFGVNNLSVSGVANITPDPNGTYEWLGTENGHNYWKHSVNTYYIYWNDTYGNWEFGTSYTDEEEYIAAEPLGIPATQIPYASPVAVGSQPRNIWDGTQANIGLMVMEEVASTSAPTVSTSAVSSIASTTATGNGNVTATGGADVTERGVYYSTSNGFSDGTGTKVSTTGTWSSTGTYTQDITGLTANTTYYVKAFATNSAGTGYGSQVSFTTSAVVPTATTNAATSVTSTTVTLNGSVNANNASTTVTFEYGLTTSYGSSVTAAESPVTGTSSTGVSYALTGLTPNATYHYRVVGVNSAGTTNGSDENFTTSAAAELTYSGTGNWSEAGNWSAGIPGTTTNVTVSSGTLTVDSDVTCADLTISSGAVVSVDPGNVLTVTGTLTNNAGTGGLILQADATGTGMLMNNATGVQATVEQYLVIEQWHYVGSPMTYVEDLSSVYPGCYVAWNEEAEANNGTSSGWYYLGSGDSLITMEGYAVRYGWASEGSVKATDLTASYTGTLNSGLVDTIFASEYYGYNFVSNPYPVTIDWSTSVTVFSTSDHSNPINRYNTNDAIYLWNPDLGTYGSYVNGSSTNGQNQYIAPTQGFFVQVTNVSSALSFTNDAKIGTQTAPFKSETIDTQIKLYVSSGSLFDESVIRITPDATSEFDGDLDASKMISGVGYSDTPQLYSVVNDQNYSINSIPELSESLVIPLEVLAKTSGEHKLGLRELKAFNYPYPIVLFDDEKNALARLDNGDYSFAGEKGEVKNFYLGFKSTLASNPELHQRDIKLLSGHLSVEIHGAGSDLKTISIFSLMGTKVSEITTRANDLVIPVPLSGIYAVRIGYESGYVFTQKVFINQ